MGTDSTKILIARRATVRDRHGQTPRSRACRANDDRRRKAAAVRNPFGEPIVAPRKHAPTCARLQVGAHGQSRRRPRERWPVFRLGEANVREGTVARARAGWTQHPLQATMSTSLLYSRSARSLLRHAAARSRETHSNVAASRAYHSLGALSHRTGLRTDSRAGEHGYRWKPGTTFRGFAGSRASSASGRQRDYYEVLGVSRTASASELKKAYYQLAKQHHPDTAGGDPSVFAEINSAYEVLSDDNKRRMYDDYGHEGVAAADAGASASGYGRTTGPSPEDILRDFGAFFSGGMGGPMGNTNMARRSVDDPAPGADKQTVVRLTFMEAAKGTARRVRVRAAKTCSDCHGSGKTRMTSIETCPDCNGEGHIRGSPGGGLFGAVFMTCRRCSGTGDIMRNPCGTCSGVGVVPETKETMVDFPPGADSGMVLRVSNAGDDGIRGGVPGDLYIHVEVAEDDYFHRDGTNLHVVAPISIAQAALGGEVSVKTIDGEETVHVPSGTQSDDTKTLRGRAMHAVKSSRRGDQVVHFKIVVPTKLSDEQRDLLTKLAALDGGSIRSHEECSSPGLLRKFQRFLKGVVGTSA